MKRALSSSVVILSGLFAAACGDSTPEAKTPTATPATSNTVTAVTPPPAPAAMESKPAEPKKEEPKAPAKKLVATYSGFQTPESVLVDGDRYLVSNINGSPFAKDNNGFISVIDANTGKVTEKWIEGGKNKVTLNAPKGSTIAKGILYVADIDVIRKFDAKTGAPKGEIAVKGATFLNDVASSEDGSTIYFTDSGFKQGEKGDFAPSGSDAIYFAKNEKVEVLRQNVDLHAPNGIVRVPAKGGGVEKKNDCGRVELYRMDDIVFATFGKKTVQRNNLPREVIKPGNPGCVMNGGITTPKTEPSWWEAVQTKVAPNASTSHIDLPTGSLDGIAELDKENVLVSSWEGKAVYRLNKDGKITTEIDNVEAPADIAYDKSRHLLLIPRFMGNIVEAYEVK